MMRTSVTAAFLTALACATGCEDSPLTAGKDFKMTLSASPATVTTIPGHVAIVALITSDTGVPQKGLTVFFDTDFGSLDPATVQGVTTNANGAAFNTLTVPTAPIPATAPITVSAKSTTLTQTVKVTYTDPCATNTPPTATLLASSVGVLSGGLGTTVNFTADGSSSTDRGSITLYAWNCGNLTTGGNGQIGTCHYVVEVIQKVYTVTLTVTDDGLGAPGYACKKSSSATTTVTVAAGSQ